LISAPPEHKKTGRKSGFFVSWPEAGIGGAPDRIPFPVQLPT